MTQDHSLQVEPMSHEIKPVTLKFVPYAGESSPQSMRTKKAISQKGHKLALETPKTIKKGEVRHLSGKKKCKTEPINQHKKLSVMANCSISPFRLKYPQPTKTETDQVHPVVENSHNLKESV